MASLLVTGASRGLGLEFSRQYAADGWRVYATCRDPRKARALAELEHSSKALATVHRLDVSNGEQVEALAKELDGEAIDMLINNAGIFGGGYEMTFGNTDYALWEETLQINTLGPLRMAEAFIDHIVRSERKLIVNISTRMGSVADNGSGGHYLYRSSKAGLNMVTKSLAVDLQEKGIIAVALHPGWVRTDQGGPEAPITPAQSVASLRAVIAKLSFADSGRFIAYNAMDIPW